MIEIVTTPANEGGNFSHTHAFVDGVTIRGCHNGVGHQDPNGVHGGIGAGSGAGIYMTGHDDIVAINISNCFIVDNDVGIALNSAWWYDDVMQQHHVKQKEPRIVNNTFARNGIAIWAGDKAESPFLNVHAPAILNNVFAIVPPGGPGVHFEGIHAVDVTVAWAALNRTSPMIAKNKDYNAWEHSAARVNTGQQLFPNWPTTVGDSVAAFPPARVNIANYDYYFLNDLLDMSGASGVSPHDYRLAPMVGYLGNEPAFPNPLADAGLFARCQMANGAPIIEAEGPGVPTGSEEVEITGWVTDCEGFGNRRVDGHRHYPVIANPPLGEGLIDIGADELSNSIVSGYCNRTRMFVSAQNPEVTLDRTEIFFFDRNDILDTGLGQWRPNFNGIGGQGYKWYDHKHNAPDAFPLSAPPWQGNYTMGPISLVSPMYWSSRSYATWVSIAVPPERKVFMRNLHCDFSPHLMPDMHPFWPSFVSSHYPITFIPLQYRLPEIHSSNAWYSNIADMTGQQIPQMDNPALYHNIGLGQHATGVYVAYQNLELGVQSAKLNPPLTWNFPNTHLFQPVSLFTSLAPCTPGLLTFVPGPWCYNTCRDVMTVVPALVGYGFRFNFERVATPGVVPNIQTFLYIPGAAQQPAQGGSSRPSATLRTTPLPSLAELRGAVFESSRRKQ